MKKIILVLISVFSLSSYAQNGPKEILLIGTFHFSNPGADVVKTNSFNVLSEKTQKELEDITNKIKEFNPDKVFVEWEYDAQSKLDSLYSLYYNGNYWEYVDKNHPKSKFYRQNEIFQLAFRLAKKCKLNKVHAIDYPYTEFPFDSVMAAIDPINQPQLKENINQSLAEFTKSSNEDYSKLSIKELLLKYNETAYRRMGTNWYFTYLNGAGAKDNFAGAYLVSEWFKRNLYMYALLQKITESKDKKVMVLLGSSHIAMFKEFIALDENFKAIELKELLK